MTIIDRIDAILEYCFQQYLLGEPTSIGNQEITVIRYIACIFLAINIMTIGLFCKVMLYSNDVFMSLFSWVFSLFCYYVATRWFDVLSYTWNLKEYQNKLIVSRTKCHWDEYHSLLMQHLKAIECDRKIVRWDFEFIEMAIKKIEGKTSVYEALQDHKQKEIILNGIK